MRTPASAAKKPTVPAAANDPFEFEPDEAEPRSSGSKASKTATPAAEKATPKPPAKSKGTSTTKENVFDFPADDDGGEAESEAQRPARKQPAQPAPKAAARKQPAPKQPAAKQPAPKQPAAKQPAPKQPAAKQPAPKQPAAKQPGWVEPAARSGPEKTFGRTPKPSSNMRDKDVHSVPDLDDVFDFAPAEVTLPRGATG